VVVGALLIGGALVPTTRAATPDKADVVLVLDFSASILEDSANRNRFGAALERIASRVDQISADLTAGDATVTIVQFATRAADYPGCTDLKLLGNADAVRRFADCLRTVARAYRRGLDPALSRRIGIDTNYVAAMEQAARHLPADAARPTLILFTDGKHDVRNVPAGRVQTVRTRLFASRSPIALLPVGMGLDPRERRALEAGLLRLRIIRDMPACASGAVVGWPSVVFGSADAAGNAVAAALHDATCTFTVEPTPSLPPTSVELPAPVQAIQIAGLDGRIELSWSAPTGAAEPIAGYRVRCGTDDGNWIEATQGLSPETRATVGGLTNGARYQCEIASVGASGQAVWTRAPTTAVPIGLPAAPARPSVAAMDGAVELSVAATDPAAASSYRYECSNDNGSSWPAELAVSGRGTSATIVGLTNGAQYVCRAYAANVAGLSAPSALSAAVTPCGSVIECNASLPPILAIVGILLVVAFAVASILFLRDSNRGYVVAVVDSIHTANLGHGSNLGIKFIRGPNRGAVVGIAAERGRDVDIPIRVMRGGRFRVTDRTGRHVTVDGEPIVVLDRAGVRHQLVLQAFSTRSATQMSTRAS
jgi:hypothetical protein